MYSLAYLLKSLLTAVGLYFYATFWPENSADFAGSATVQYVGAVLEFAPYTEWSPDVRGQEIALVNAQRILDSANIAKEKSADILVAPEHALNGYDLHENDTEEFKTFLHHIPDSSSIPCDQDVTSQTVKTLSCGARDLSMYLVVPILEIVECFGVDNNECPSQGFNAFITMTVFGKNGEIITKYRKVNTYSEDRFTAGNPDDGSDVFVADFNVRFSLMVSFDIVHERPGFYNVKNRGVNDVLMSIGWVDQYPFDLANAIQEGWSRGLKTNLLVSGNHDSAQYSVGSGIYRGHAGDDTVNVYEPCSGSVLITSKIKTKPFQQEVISDDLENLNLVIIMNRNTSGRERYMNLNETEMIFEDLTTEESTFTKLEEDSGSIIDQNINCQQHSILERSDLSSYAKTLLVPTTQFEKNKTVSICTENEFCCSITYSYTGNNSYYFMAKNGEFLVGDGRYSLKIQQCALLWCESADFESCGRRADVSSVKSVSDSSAGFGPFIIQSSDFNADLVFPVTLHKNLSLIDQKSVIFESSDIKSVESEIPISDVLVVALYGRVFK